MPKGEAITESGWGAGRGRPATGMAAEMGIAEAEEDVNIAADDDDEDADDNDEGDDSRLAGDVLMSEKGCCSRRGVTCGEGNRSGKCEWTSFECGASPRK